MTATPAPPAGAPAGLLALLDRLTAKLARHNRSVRTALGNHDYIGFPVEASELAALLTAARRGAEQQQEQKH